MDGNTHNLVSTNSLLSVKTSVRVQCEAFDCGALLEIEIPNNQNGQSPVIVRCGNCQRLLEVWLNKGTRDVTSKTRILPQHSTPPLRLTLDKPSSPTFEFQTKSNVELITMCGPTGLTSPSLAKPPPLSRSLYSTFQPATRIRPFSLNVMQTNFLMNKQTLSTPPFLSQVNTNSRSITSGVHSMWTNDSLQTISGGETRNRRGRRHRHPSPYNRFMSREVKRIKVENPDVDHRKAFRMAASNWARSPTNCQRFYSEVGDSEPIVDQHSASSVAESKDPPSLETEDPVKTMEVSKGSRKRSQKAPANRLPSVDDLNSL